MWDESSKCVYLIKLSVCLQANFNEARARICWREQCNVATSESQGGWSDALRETVVSRMKDCNHISFALLIEVREITTILYNQTICVTVQPRLSECQLSEPSIIRTCMQTDNIIAEFTTNGYVQVSVRVKKERKVFILKEKLEICWRLKKWSYYNATLKRTWHW